MNKQVYRMPRSLKRYLILQTTGDAHRDGEIRRVMISADKARQEFKNRRSVAPDHFTGEPGTEQTDSQKTV